MKRFHVRLSAEAEQDLIDIYRYIAYHDSVESAGHVLDQLETVCSRLTGFPQRGHIPPELEWIAVTNFRELNFKPWRIIYEVIHRDVFIHCILDGRRDMLALLERRLLR